MSNAYTFLHDAPAEHDSLGRVPFATALARSLALPKDAPGLVVGIEGSWGSGKSTLIRMITKELDEVTGNSRPLVVPFNPWMIGATGALVEAMISQIAVAIGVDPAAGERGIKAGQKLLGYIGIFNKLKYLKMIPGAGWAGNIAEAAGEFFQASETLVEDGGKTLEEMKKFLPTIDLAGQKAAVIAALREFDRPIVIIIDDLDRLMPAEIQAMMQAIKAVADFPRITYLLAYDRAIVASALASSEARGIDYLAKIVQVAYPIPPLFNRQRVQLIDEKIRAFFGTHDISLSEFDDALWGDAKVVLAKLLPQPRDIVRLVNRLILSVPATRREVNTVDVIVFEALSLRFPQLREATYRDSQDFVGDFHENEVVTPAARYAEKDLLVTKGTEASAWQRHLPPNEPSALAACEFLFSKRTIFTRNGADLLRIGDPDRLARLLRMTSIAGIPEVSEIQTMLTDKEKFEEALDSDDHGETLILLQWICNHVRSLSNLDTKDSVEVLVSHANTLNSAIELDRKLSRQISHTVSLLLEVGPGDHGNLLQTVSRESPLDVAARVVTGVYAKRNSDGRNHRGHNATTPPAPYDTAVDSAVKLLLHRLHEWIAQGALGDSKFVHELLQTLKTLDSQAVAQAAVNRLTETDEWLEIFLKGFEDRTRFTRAFDLISDVDNFASRIESVPRLSDDYNWLIEMLRSDQSRFRQDLERKLSPKEES
jgi:hypothetical protein